ncbi:MAG TPA: carboxypeptidase regulatory-like domain-containing protein [Pyrinomonadaceae bacterium]|nr:carboxypeptidase regulatory-like domain-containing protein [Pyrinomonadaceae bacterium]
MKKVPLVFGMGILLALALTPVTGLANSSAEPLVIATVIQGRSSIYGNVYGEGRRPVADVYVELLDDVNSTIRQIKTDMSGRFQFSGLVDGRYMLKIRPGNTGYLEYTQQVIIAAVSSVRPTEVGGRSGGSDTQHIDIALKLDERGLYGPFAAAPGVVFAQDVPAAAKQHYDEAITQLRAKKEEQAFASLRQALEVFPDYYAALDRLGGEYAVRGVDEKGTNQDYLQAGLVLLTKATQVNPRSYSSMYGLGWTEYHLGMTNEAIDHLGKATTIYGKAASAYLLQAKAYRRTKMLDKAEEALKRADQLANGKDADIHWQLAGVYNDQKRFGEAADQMELYLKNAPKGEDPEKIKGLIKRLRDLQAKAK